MEPVKLFECSCLNGFTGDFCEFKTDQNELLYLETNNAFVFNDLGQPIKESLTLDYDVGASFSCSTMLNGEAVVFGGSGGRSRRFNRQVTNSDWFCLTFVHFLDFCCLRMWCETTW